MARSCCIRTSSRSAMLPPCRPSSWDGGEGGGRKSLGLLGLAGPLARADGEELRTCGCRLVPAAQDTVYQCFNTAHRTYGGRGRRRHATPYVMGERPMGHGM